MMRATLIAVGFALMVAPAGCADDREGGRSSTTSAPTTPVSLPSASPSAEGERWIAVIDVVADPNDLDALTQQLLEPLGTALVVAPADCFEGLPEQRTTGMSSAPWAMPDRRWNVPSSTRGRRWPSPPT
jgi:hypothetical protein